MIDKLSSDSKSITKRSVCQVDYQKFIENAKNDRMEAAVNALAVMLLETDVDSIKMTDVAEACDIGVASLYRYFGNKSVMVIKAACKIWENIRSMFDGVFECDYYQKKSGIDQVKELMKVFKVLYLSHKDFLRFVDSFDRFVIENKISTEQLSDYQASVLNIYPLFNEAFTKGVNDGTVKGDIDFPIMYLSITHALMLMSEKFARGSIFEGESEYEEKELDFIIDMAIRSIST